jgi:hypothetical protein
LSPLLLLHKSCRLSALLCKSRRSSERHLDKLLLPFVLLFHHLLLLG